MTIGGSKVVIAETEKKIVALAVADGKQLWETPFAVPGRGYNASSPVVEGTTIIYCGSGRGATAVKLEKEGENLAGKELWKNPDNSVQFNTPILKNKVLFGLTANNDFFCLDATDGKTKWTAPLTPPAPAAPAMASTTAPAVGTNAAGTSTGSAAPAGGQGGRGGRGGGGGRGGYGAIVDAGPVLLALTPASELVAFEPNEKAYTEVARIKVAETPTYTYPVVSGNRIFVKDQDSVILWTVP